MVPTELGTPLSAEDFAQKSEQLMKEREEEEQNAAASSAELTESEKQDEELNAFTKSEVHFYFVLIFKYNCDSLD